VLQHPGDTLLRFPELSNVEAGSTVLAELDAGVLSAPPALHGSLPELLVYRTDRRVEIICAPVWWSRTVCAAQDLNTVADRARLDGLTAGVGAREQAAQRTEGGRRRP
jgi:hypothetical protein